MEKKKTGGFLSTKVNPQTDAVTGSQCQSTQLVKF